MKKADLNLSAEILVVLPLALSLPSPSGVLLVADLCMI